MRIGGELLKPLRRGSMNIVQKRAVQYLAADLVGIDLLRESLEKLTSTGDWVVGKISDRVVAFSDIPPFTKWLKPEQVVALASGELIIFAAVSMEGYREMLLEKGVSIEWKPNQTDYPDIRYTPIAEPYISYMADFKALAFMQQWRWERVLYGFYSLSSFAELVLFGFNPEQFAQAAEKRKAFEDGGKKVTVKTIELRRTPFGPAGNPNKS
jgi:hypothetical protein